MAFRGNRNGLTRDLSESSGSAGGSNVPLVPDDIARAAGSGRRTSSPEIGQPTTNILGVAAGSPADIWLVPVADASKATRIVSAPADQMHPNLSPDGRFIAYTSSESGRYEVYVETLPSSDRKWPISTDGGYEPRWRGDGKEIYLPRVRRHTDGGIRGPRYFTIQHTKPLFQSNVYGGVEHPAQPLHPVQSGSRFLVAVKSRDPVSVPITIVLNWAGGLKSAK